MHLEIVDVSVERARLIAETAEIRARLDAEVLDGKLSALADAGDRLLLEAELAKLGSTAPGL